jgi:hypothetical protein
MPSRSSYRLSCLPEERLNRRTYYHNVYITDISHLHSRRQHAHNGGKLLWPSVVYSRGVIDTRPGALTNRRALFACVRAPVNPGIGNSEWTVSTAKPVDLFGLRLWTAGVLAQTSRRVGRSNGNEKQTPRLYVYTCIRARARVSLRIEFQMITDYNRIDV